MSLFFCICQGKWDALQLWPFGHVVTFTLMDQNEHPEDRQHHSQTLATNPCKENRVFLGRPVGVRNAFIGTSLCCGLLVRRYSHTCDISDPSLRYIRIRR